VCGNAVCAGWRSGYRSGWGWGLGVAGRWGYEGAYGDAVPEDALEAPVHEARTGMLVGVVDSLLSAKMVFAFDPTDLR